MKNSYSRLPLLALGLTAALPPTARAQGGAGTRVTVDASINHQAMEGWGFSLPGVVPMTIGGNPLASFPFENGADGVLYDLLFDPVSGLGITHLSVYNHWDLFGSWSGVVAETYEEVNDDVDPFTMNPAGFALVPEWPNWMVLQKAAPYGVRFKLQLGVTPDWMEIGDSLVPSMREEFGEYLSAYLIYARDALGLDIPYLTIRNEPNGGGQVFTPTELADTMDVVAQMLDFYGLATQFVAPETSTLGNAITYSQELLQHPTAMARMHAFSTHPYPLGTDGFWNWQTLASIAQSTGRPLWQGEISTESADLSMQDALVLAELLHRHLTFGDVSVWYYFLGVGSTTGLDGGDEGALIQFTPGTGSEFGYFLPKRYFAFGQYSRFVRPGAVRLGVTTSHTVIRSMAFRDSSRSSFSLVVANESANPRTVVFALENLKPIINLDVYRTSSAENLDFVEMFPVSGNSFTYTLPAQSVTTFTGALFHSRNRR